MNIQTYYTEEFGETPAFVQVFLADINMLAIQTLLTTQLRSAVDNATIPTMAWTNGLTAALLNFAYTYRSTPPTPQAVAYANWVFADQMLAAHETLYDETTFWNRWCEQGLPDPNNIPLPLGSEKSDFTVETSSYILSDPIGYQRFPTC